MSAEWQDTTIGAVCLKVFSGGTPTSTNPSYYGGAIPWLRTKEVNYGKVFDTEQHITELGLENSSAKLVPVNSVIVAMYGNGDTAGRVAVNKIPLTTNQACCNLVVDPAKADFRFVYYFLMGRYQELVDLKNGGAQQNLNGQLIKAFPFCAPDVCEQSAIANVFESLDDRITLLRETNTTLEAIAQALFKSWFVDFDPVRAKMEDRAPESMDEATAALFPDSFEESAVGLVPRGWAYAAIRDVVEGVYDGPHATPPEVDAGPVFLGIKNLTGTALDLGEIRHIAEAQWQQWTRRVEPKGGDIVFSYEATLGFFALIPEGLRCCLGRRLALIRPKPIRGAGHFWFHQFVAAPFQRLLTKHTIQGATVNRIALKEFPSYGVLNPPLSLQVEFDMAVAPLWAKIHDNQRQAQTLATLRDTLLPRLISGQLRLPEAQTATEAALSGALQA